MEGKMTSVSECPWNIDNELVLTAPYRYLLNHPGKDIRRELVKALNEVFCAPEKYLSFVQHVTEGLHTASLLLDDVEDDSLLRRGRPTAHLIYGKAQTVNSATYMVFIHLQNTKALLGDQAASFFIEEMMFLHRGQGLDIHWRESSTCPTESEYLNMVANKTGGLFRLAARLLSCHGENYASLSPFLNALGVYYQIQDDYLNLIDGGYQTSKGFCDDISEGKYSFPVIHSLRAKPHSELGSILRLKTQDPGIKQVALKCLEETKSLDYTLSFLQMQSQEVINELQRLKANGHNVTALERLVHVALKI